MSEGTTGALTASLPQKGATIRTTRLVRFQTHEGTCEHPVGTRGVVTSVGDAVVWAKVAGYEMEMLPGEYEVAQ